MQLPFDEKTLIDENDGFHPDPADTEVPEQGGDKELAKA